MNDTMNLNPLGPHRSNLLLISPTVDLGRENGMSLPLQALLRHLPEHGYRVAWHMLGDNRIRIRDDGEASLRVTQASVVRAAGLGLRRIRPASSLMTLRSQSVVLPLGSLDWDPARDIVVCYLAHGTELGLATPARRHALVAQDVLAELTARRADVEPSPLRRIALRVNSLAFDRYERWAYSRCAPVTVVSEHEAKLASRRYGTTPAVVPNGIALPDQSLLETPLRPTALILGDLGSPRNALAARRAIEALPPLLERSGTAVQLQLIGPRPPADLMAAARTAGVCVAGYVDDLTPLLAGASAMLALHPVATGIKNSVLTALAHGLPCLVSENVGRGLPDVVRAAVEITDLEGAAKLLHRMANDPNLRIEWGLRARAAAEEHGDWSKYVERITNLLR